MKTRKMLGARKPADVTPGGFTTKQRRTKLDVCSFHAEISAIATHVVNWKRVKAPRL